METYKHWISLVHIQSFCLEEAVMQTIEPVPTREYTESKVKIINSTYVKADLEQVAVNSFQLNFDDVIKLLQILENRLCCHLNNPTYLNLKLQHNLLKFEKYTISSNHNHNHYHTYIQHHKQL